MPAVPDYQYVFSLTCRVKNQFMYLLYKRTSRIDYVKISFPGEFIKFLGHSMASQDNGGASFRLIQSIDHSDTFSLKFICYLPVMY